MNELTVLCALRHLVGMFLVFTASMASAAEAPSRGSRMTVKQRMLVCEQNIRDFDRRWRIENGHPSDDDIQTMLRYVTPLFNEIYIQNVENCDRPLSFSQAERYIDARNANTRQKYLTRAIEKDFLVMEPCLRDRRKKLLRPTSQMIDLVEREHTERLDELFKLIEEFDTAGAPAQE